ncbi:hypothetical protein COA17_12195 [Sphingomonas ginsenosidimutans]|jgi:hypothetical protein|uniref:DUF1656 domain-containing protein n=1 Tax=Sphingomonas ginsenosidimutans TaxID=862134 RepID=A0A2A4HXR0_9SPHN|nr:DUF1656 domain-containing protein [Sphingomonas ginsenosidimutans]PCG08447.1 hypothetical protein COA17_12195 [Sphingomonas ginsenosidimutans]
MISDLDIAGILVPGLLALACLALVATVLLLRLLAVTGLSRRLALPALTEIAVFILLYSLLMRVCL